MSVALNSLTLTADATRAVVRNGKKMTYSLITNPSTCRGHWSAIATVTYPSQKIGQTLRAPCRK